MAIMNESELISRLVEILNYKDVGFQNKLRDIEKKERLLNILEKNTISPLNGLLELKSDELSSLFSEFMGNTVTKNDVKVMKYWIKEGTDNKALQDSFHYKEAIKSFNLLFDKMQMFLDYMSDFSIKKEEVLSNLDLIESLKDRLSSNDIIKDMSIYYPIIKPSETLLCDQIYDMLVAISLKNSMKESLNITSKDIKVSFNKDVKAYIISLLEEQIESKGSSDDLIVESDDRVVALRDLCKKIKDNFDVFLTLYPDTIRNTMEDIWTNKEIDNYLNKLSIPLAVIKGKKQGLSLTFDDEDIAIINDFVDTLSKKADELSEQTVKVKQVPIQENKEVEEIKNTISKLKIANQSLLELDDFELIINTLKSKQDFEYIIEVINMLNALNLKKLCKEEALKEVEEENKSVKIITKKKTVTKAEITAMESLLSKYGFHFQAFSPKLIEELIKSSSFEHVEEIASYIDNSKSLSFLKDYTIVRGNSSLDKQIQEIKCSQIFFILTYSNIEILENFEEIAKRDELNLNDIFAIPKVFASKNNEELIGTYENFIINEKYLKDEYPLILHPIMERCSFILGTDSYLFKHNIELTNLYGMSVEKDSKGILPSPLALTVSNFDYLMDRFIEAQDYDYIECYRYQLETNAMAALHLKYLKLKDIDIVKKEYVNIFDCLDEELEEYLDNLSIENISIALRSPIIKWLDKQNEEKDPNKKNIQYILNGIYISRIKVLKYFGTLLNNKYSDKIEALLYSITKDSYLTEQEFNSLRELVNEREDK